MVIKQSFKSQLLILLLGNLCAVLFTREYRLPRLILIRK